MATGNCTNANISGADAADVHELCDDDYETDEESNRVSSSTSVVSLLQRLKSPTPAEISCKRKINPPPKGKRQCQEMASTGPKGVTLSQQVKEFPNEQVTVSADKLFCVAFRSRKSIFTPEKFFW